MREDLIKRFALNKKDHESVRAAIEILKADQSDPGVRLAYVQQGLAVTTDQVRNNLEKIITDSRTAARGGALRSVHFFDRPGPL